MKLITLKKKIYSSELNDTPATATNILVDEEDTLVRGMNQQKKGDDNQIRSLDPEKTTKVRSELKRHSVNDQEPLKKHKKTENDQSTDGLIYSHILQKLIRVIVCVAKMKIAI